VSFGIGEREIVALAGESGSGKSTIARVLARIYAPTSGEIYFEGKPVSAIRSRRDRLRYSGLMPMVFQDPFGSINPVFRVQHGMLRSLKLHRPALSARQRQEEAERVFEVVGLGADMLQRFPYELSGGQRQRVGFAQALAMRPRLILADQRAVRGGPADRDVRRPDRRGGPDRGGACPPEAPVYPAAAVRRAGSAGAAFCRCGDRPRRAAQGHRPHPWLPVPLALPACHRCLRAGHAGARRTGTPA
jgi:predicted ABC-type transport system involved in lysophospholipase L1 biosynthesis ATPase subunit